MIVPWKKEKLLGRLSRSEATCVDVLSSQSETLSHGFIAFLILLVSVIVIVFASEEPFSRTNSVMRSWQVWVFESRFIFLFLFIGSVATLKMANVSGKEDGHEFSESPDFLGYLWSIFHCIFITVTSLLSIKVDIGDGISKNIREWLADGGCISLLLTLDSESKSRATLHCSVLTDVWVPLKSFSTRSIFLWGSWADSSSSQHLLKRLGGMCTFPCWSRYQLQSLGFQHVKVVRKKSITNRVIYHTEISKTLRMVRYENVQGQGSS